MTLELGRPGWLRAGHPRLFDWFMRVGSVCSDAAGWTREVTERSRGTT